MEGATMERIAPTADQLQRLSPDQFRAWAQTRQEAVAEIVQCISEQVENNRLTPFEGGSGVAALYGAVFGYRQFHGELAPSDLVQSLSDSLRSSR